MQIYENKKATNVENNILQQLLFKYLPYWPIFLLFLLLSLVGAWFYLRNKTPLYESTASILIKDEKKGEDNSKMTETINQLSAKKIVENEIEVIKSRTLMDEVVKKLHLYAQVYEKGPIRPISAYATSPIIIEALNPDSLVESKGKVFFTYDTSKKQISFENKYFPVSQWISTEYGVLRFIPSKSYSAKKNPFYFIIVSPEKVTYSILNGLDVSAANKLSSVIDLTLRDEVPQRSEDILNGLLIAYTNAAVNEKNSLASNTLASLDERLNAVGHDLDSIEQRLQQYKASTGAIDIGSQGSLFLQNVSANDQKLNDITYQLSALDQVEKYLNSKDVNSTVTPSTVGLNDPLLTQLLTKLYDSQLEYEKMKKTTAENNPVMLSLKDQIEKIKPSLIENVRSQKESLQTNKDNLNSANTRYSSVLQTIPRKERDIVEISREQNIKSGVYNFLLQKREETSLSIISSVADSKIIDKAQSSFGPVSPNKKLIYLMAIALAFVLAIGVITIKEIFKRTILYRHEIESFTSVPVIGEITYEKNKTPLVIGDGKRTFIAEQFRSLRTSLPYIGLKADKKRLQVTSSVSGEGKSFVVANLGVGLAMTGKKVVVVEFDLSDPTLSNKLNVTEINKGITDFLTDQAEAKELVQKTGVHDNLYIVSAGWLPENPTELIMSKKVPDLINYLSENFDYVIIDTAPVGLLSDAYILSAYCDATLYVVRHKHTRKISIQRLDENNKINELKNIAIVFNGVRSRGVGKYGYGYGYGYIYKEKKKRKNLFSKASFF